MKNSRGGQEEPAFATASWDGLYVGTEEIGDADGQLKIIYNGGELKNKQAVYTATGDNTATISLSGMELDMSDMIGGLLEWKIPTYGAVPGVKSVEFDVELTEEEDGSYSFEFAEDFEDRATIYTGAISDEGLSLEITNTLKSNPLAGFWGTPAKVVGGGTVSGDDNAGAASPFWWSFDSTVHMVVDGITYEILPGRPTPLNLKGPLGGVINTISSMGSMIFPEIMGVKGLQQVLNALLGGFNLTDSGNMGVTYAWNDNLKDPQYSNEMPANSIRFYYEGADILRVEVNPSVIVDLVGGLIGGTMDTKGNPGKDPEITKEVGKKLIAQLNPVLAAGIPVKYEQDGDNLKIWIEETWMLQTLQILAELGSDEYALDFLVEALAPLLGDTFAPVVRALLEQLPEVLGYNTGYTTYAKAFYAEHPNDLKGEISDLAGKCTWAKLGLKLVKSTDPAVAPEE